ncbi:ABC transporter substrate-binding protein [Nocardioides carbamazepini]|uniref:ABC transporter substrate-binding protein n=1 Tax=Nocardioides carbamazepini TaxID=2854259 RepID=UPI00214A4302|nr:ABC transporter substrate-binding protein [Nocardioides carbamazepini]MCR1785546.1 ABC transporter substrate-binding protein [Nocardioides carbamazepini]
MIRPSRRTRTLPALLALPLALTTLSACAGAPEPEPRKVADDGFPVEVTSCDFTSTVTAPPESAVTMNQGATEVMLALDLADHMAGTAYLDDAVPERWQAAYDEVAVLSKEYPDNETLLAAEPDFVYSSYLSAFDADAAGPRDELADLGIATYNSPFGCGEGHERAEIAFDSVWGEIETVATAFGVPERAQAIEEGQQAALDELADSRPGEGHTAFWFDSGDKTAFAGAGQGGPQLILDAVGATNVFADLEGSWADVSWERVVKADPDVIVLADASWSTADDKIALLEKDPALKELRAVRAGAYVVVPFSESTPGVRLADGAVSVGAQLAELNLG